MLIKNRQEVSLVYCTNQTKSLMGGKTKQKRKNNKVHCSATVATFTVEIFSKIYQNSFTFS